MPLAVVPELQTPNSDLFDNDEEDPPSSELRRTGENEEDVPLSRGPTPNTQHPTPPLTILTGATACGKSSVAVPLARMMGAEIVSVDSMAVYRGMDIGTAKPSPEERAEVPHHLIDIVDPAETFSAAEFARLAEECIADIRSRGREPLLVGGTPMYLRALLHGLFDGPAADWTLRRGLRALAETEPGRAELHARLRAVDPQAADRLHPNDVKRVIRAIEVRAATGRPISELQTQWGEGGDMPVRPHRMLVLDRDVDDLRRRIAGRIDAMFEAGFVEEVQALLARPEDLSRTARAAVGYAEVIQYVEQGGSLQETREAVRARTWRVARKQLTWLRGFPHAERVLVGENEPPEKTAKGLYKRV